MAILNYYRKDQLNPIKVDDSNTDLIAKYKAEN